MKKITYIVLLFLTGVAFNNCSDEIEGTKDLNYISFEKESFSVVLTQNSTRELTIKVYTTQIISIDRAFNIEVNSGSSADAEAYNVPSSVMIPANTNVGEFKVSLFDVNISPNGETVVVNFEKMGNFYSGNPITINVQVYCPLNIDDFLGDYVISEEGYGDYATTITKDPEVANRIWITNFWDWTNDLVYFDFDPETGRVNVPAQVVVMGDGEEYTVNGSGTYNACNGTFHVEYGGDVDGTIHDFNPAQ